MPTKLSDDDVELLEEPSYGHLATLMPDGSPQVTVVWVDTRDGQVWVNTAEGRVKTRNVRRDPRVAISVQDAADPWRVAMVRGRAVELTHEGADEHIDFLAKKYLGVDRYPNRAPGEQRVIVKIQPEHVARMR
jgi:PPOX class probable F420-dependent enzyme